MFKTILVAVDGSKHADKAAQAAIEMAKKFGSRLLILSVYKHYSSIESTHSLVRARHIPEPPDDTLRELCHETARWVEQQAKKAGLDEVETFVKRGPPARTIVKLARKKDVDTIVLGSRGLGDVEGFFLGSVSHKVTALAKCSCVLVQ